MVTFEPAGRLGNVFLEAATAIAYALKHGLEFHMKDGKGRDAFWNPVYWQHLANAAYNPSLETIDLWENGHQFQELPFKEEWRGKNICIHGYRQTEKYFKDYRSEILFLLGMPWEMKPGVVSIHVRRGDYVNLQNKHILYDIEYMKRATGYFRDKGFDNFKVFSDDIPWCREEFAKPEFAGMNIEFAANPDEMADVIDMSQCEHHINSSSTFSWMGAWINRNPNKIVVTPVDWFKPGWGGLDTSDIVPEEWVKM
jgi:hypothetical protein